MLFVVDSWLCLQDSDRNNWKISKFQYPTNVIIIFCKLQTIINTFLLFCLHALLFLLRILRYLRSRYIAYLCNFNKRFNVPTLLIITDCYLATRPALFIFRATFTAFYWPCNAAPRNIIFFRPSISSAECVTRTYIQLSRSRRNGTAARAKSTCDIHYAVEVINRTPRAASL